ncbi:MAG: hypothetical protein AAB552_03150 [Patescibacteria group bacterium]
MQHQKFNTKHLLRSRGSLLLELLLSISVLAIILSLSAQTMLVSLQSEKVSGERDVAVALANETLEAVRAVADEKWVNIYSLTGKGSTHYKTVQSGNAWTLATGDETIALNNASYTRYVVIENVNRCLDVEAGGGRNLASTTVGCTPSTNYLDDPSTQKATVTVSWTGGNPIVISEYFFRWRNKVCNQTGWTGNGGSGNSVVSCTDTTYDIADSAISTSTGTLRLE